MSQLLLIDNIAVYHPTVSDAQDPDNRHVENLSIFAPRVLDHLFKHKHTLLYQSLDCCSLMEQMLKSLPHVATYYNLDKDQLLQQWVEHYAPTYYKKL